MIHRFLAISCGNGQPTECWATHNISKNQRDNEPVDRPLCNYLQRKVAFKKPTTADVPLRYKACKGQEWVGQGPMVALAAARLGHIVPDVTHPKNWETTASQVSMYVLMGSPCPAISTNPPELSMEVPAAPNQSWNKYDVASYHLMQALFPPENHEERQNIVNPDRQTLEEWPVHGAPYPGVRLQTQRDAVTWFPLPLQNALYNAIYEQWILSVECGEAQTEATGVRAAWGTPHGVLWMHSALNGVLTKNVFENKSFSRGNAPGNKYKHTSGDPQG